MRTCQSIRINDEYHCRSCSLRWSVDDPEPPSCGLNALADTKLEELKRHACNDVPNSYLAAKNGL